MGRRARPALPTPCSLVLARPIARARSTREPVALDVDEEEKRRHFTIDCHLGHLAWDGKQVHLIDTPGYPDFIGSALSALAAVENVVVAVSGPSGIEVNTRRVFQEAGRLGLGRFVVVTKMDADNVDYRSDLEAIRETFGTQCVPFNVPVGQGSTLLRRGRRDPVARRGPARVPAGSHRGLSHGRRANRRARRGPDDALPGRARQSSPMNFAEPLTTRSHRASSFPCSASAPARILGLRELLDLITSCGLSPADVHRYGTRSAEADGAEEEILPAEEGTLVAQVFKTVNDQFMGKLSYLRILTGQLTADTTLVNLRSGKTAKTGHVYVLQGKQQEEIPVAIAGDIVAIAKFDDLHVSDTISNVGETPQSPNYGLGRSSSLSPWSARRPAQGPR